MTALKTRALVADLSSTSDDERDPLDQALAAVRRLAQASAVLLLTYDELAPVDPAIRQAGEVTGSAYEAELLAGIGNSHAGWPIGQDRWFAGGKQGGATFCVKVAAHRRRSSVMLLAFTDAVAVARARVARMAPDLVALVAAQLASEARLRGVQERQVAAAIALDHGACGVIALRADHSLLFASSAAATILAEGDGLQLRRGLVRPSDYRCAVRFEAALDAVLDGPQPGATGKPSALVMLLPRAREGRPMIAVIAPAGVDEPTAECGALLYVLQPGPGLTRGVDTLAQLHGLSRVETRLLAHLCEGMTVTDSAAAMRIKLETARAYLKQIFAKTGTHRQTELVALMSRYLRAVRGDFDFRAA